MLGQAVQWQSGARRDTGSEPVAVVGRFDAGEEQPVAGADTGGVFDVGTRNPAGDEGFDKLHACTCDVEAAIGSVGHLTGEMLRMMTGAKLLHVPYKGAAPATADLVGGQVQLSFSSMPAVLPFVKAGKLRMIAVTSSRRASSQPDLPTIAESGVPGFEATGWYGFVGPAGLPRERVSKLDTDFGAALDAPDIRAKLISQGLDPWHTSPEDMRSFMATEITKWTKVIRQAGAAVD